MILPKKDAALFYKLNWSLLYYVNQKYPVIKGLKKPDLTDEDANKILELHETFYSHLELIDSFVTKNPFELNQEELGIIKSWKKAIKDRFFIISHQKDHTIFLQNGKIPKAYGVLGLYDEIRDFIPKPPVPAETILLPFKGKIIHCGVITSSNPKHIPIFMDIIRKKYQQARKRFGIICSMDELIYLDENFADLIYSELGVNWNQIEADLPKMSTKKLVDEIGMLGLYVNKKIALEIIKRDDAVFWLRNTLQDEKYWSQNALGDVWLLFHTIHLLALIKTKEALEFLLDIVRYHGDELSDWLTEDVPSLFVSFGECAIEPLKEFTSEETLESFARGSGSTALAALAMKYPAHKNGVKEHLIQLLNDTGNYTFASLLVSDLASIKDPSVLPVINRAFDEDKIETEFITIKDVESIINDEYKNRLSSHIKDPMNHFSRENIEYLHSLNQPEDEEENSNWFDDDESFDFETNEKTMKNKIGRNDSCPCGSGKKYKKCCMGKEK